MLIGDGTGAGLTNRVLGDDSGGAEDAIVVSHTHGGGSLAADSGGAHTHDIDRVTTLDTGSTVKMSAHALSETWANVPGAAKSAGAHTHTISGTSGAAGSSGTDANMPPWLAIKTLIKL